MFDALLLLDDDVWLMFDDDVDEIDDVVLVGIVVVALIPL